MSRHLPPPTPRSLSLRTKGAGLFLYKVKFKNLRLVAYNLIMIGVDEVGRGCLAGPLLVVAARNRQNLPKNLKDSKLLTRSQRETLYPLLVETCDFGEGWVKATEIDKLGLGACLRLGVRRALASLKAKIDEEIIMDGIVNYVPNTYKNGRSLVDADESIPLVSAASIYAKVTRDRFMIELAKLHPKYRFEDHVGYGTPQHRQVLDKLGPIKLVHRLSFAPFRQTSLL